MNTTFFICWGLILAFDGVLMGTLTWAATSEKYRKYRIRTPKSYEIPRGRKIINTQLNNILSLSMFGAFAYFLGDRVLYAGWPGITGLLGQALGILLLYDFMYYFLHRAGHHPKVMKYVHGVHHFVRYPTSDESIYLHPGETLAGVGLLLLAVVIVGPVSTVSFLVMFAIYSSVNIIVHSNLVIPHPAFRLFNFWTTTHDVHHSKVRHNYASIFPFWDQMFGTHRKAGEA
jgi:sterol desaturase/sphingolipid hydroxylase (fatty acid hydroxylase superfamily)